jgi:hypothetical protein
MLYRKGVLRSYTDEREMNIVQFVCFEGWWITDLSSYLTGANSTYISKQLKIQNYYF